VISKIKQLKPFYGFNCLNGLKLYGFNCLILDITDDELNNVRNV